MSDADDQLGGTERAFTEEKELDRPGLAEGEEGPDLATDEDPDAEP